MTLCEGAASPRASILESLNQEAKSARKSPSKLVDIFV